MAVKTGDAITVSFTTQRFDTGAATNADSLPTGTLYVNGVSNAATVTVTNTTTGQYSAAVTLPTLAIGDRCEIAIAATVNSVAGRGIIWRDAYDVATDSSGRVTVGSNADKTGYSLTQSFPANFASLGINSSGHVSRVVLVDTTTTNSDMRGTDNALLATSYTEPLSASGTAGAVWNALLASYTVAGSFGQRVMTVDSTSTGNGAKVTPNGHVAAVVHDAEPDSIPEDAFLSGAFSARVIATDAITAAKIAADVGTEIGVAVWASSTRELTSGANIVLAKGAGITGFNDITAASVWSVGTRELTSGANIVLAKGTGLTGLNDLSQADIRTATGLSAANLDSQLTAIKSDTAAILDDTGTSGVVVASGSKGGYSLSSSGLDAVLIDGVAMPKAVQIMAASVAGKVSGAGTASEIFKGLDGITTRMTVTADESGNRSNVVYVTT